MSKNNFCYDVNLPLTNRLQAERDIFEFMLREDIADWRKLVRRPKVTFETGRAIDKGSPVEFYVDAFMAQYPRGSGTTGDYRLRFLYAACKTIKIANSRTKYFRQNRVRLVDLSKSQTELLARLPLDGSSIAGEDFGGSALVLIRHGLINGCIGNRDETTYWLTDHGLGLAKNIPVFLADRKLKAQMESVEITGSSDDVEDDDHVDYDAMKRAILNANQRDAKAFIRNVRKVMAVLGGK